MSPIWKSNAKKNKINIVSVRFKRLKSEHTIIVRIVLLFMCSKTKIVNEKKTTTKTQIPICAYVTPSLEVGKCQSLKIFLCIIHTQNDFMFCYPFDFLYRFNYIWCTSKKKK